MRVKEYIIKRICRVCGRETNNLKQSMCSCGSIMYPIGYIYTKKLLK